MKGRVLKHIGRGASHTHTPMYFECTWPLRLRCLNIAISSFYPTNPIESTIYLLVVALPNSAQFSIRHPVDGLVSPSPILLSPFTTSPLRIVPVSLTLRSHSETRDSNHSLGSSSRPATTSNDHQSSHTGVPRVPIEIPHRDAIDLDLDAFSSIVHEHSSTGAD